MATQVSSSGGSIATVSPQPKRDLSRSSRPVDLARIAVAGQDDLVLALEQRVEGMEELFLRVLLAGEELDVVDQQRMQRAVRGLEIVHAVVLQRPHHVADEALRVHVGDARFAVTLLDQVADGVHEVGLAEADAAVDEQRVIGAAGIVGDLQGGGLGEVVALALDESVEGEVRIERAPTTRPSARRGRCAVGDAAPGGLPAPLRRAWACCASRPPR